MYKIYSRPRIRIPRFKKIILRKTHFQKPSFQTAYQKSFQKSNEDLKNFEKKKKITKIIIIFIIAFSTMKLILDAVLPIFDTLCENKAQSIATIISNEQATKVMTEHSYDELFTVQKDKNGNVSMIQSNVVPINAIISDVANYIQKEINKQGKDSVSIAMRKLYRV